MRETLKRLISAALVAALLSGAQAPSIARASVAAAAASRGPAVSVPGVASLTSDWRLYPEYGFSQDFPGLPGRSSLPRPDITMPALRRSLARTGLSPEAVTAMPAEAQLRVVISALKRLAAVAAKEAMIPESEAEELSIQVRKASDKLAAVRDIRLAIALLPREERKPLGADLYEASKAVEERFRRKSAALVESKLEALSAPGGVSWNGRTADIPLDGGAVLSLKWHTDLSGGLRREGAKMEDARLFGIDSPIPLPEADGSFGHREEAPRQASREFKRVNDLMPYEYFLPYLMPSDLAGEFRAYLNDKLPKALGEEAKARKIEKAAVKAVDHMLLLHNNGRAHSTLAPISHDWSAWEWDFWRWNPPFLGGLRFGPSYLNHWRKGFKYPNLRLSGLADFEHIEPWPMFRQEHKHNDHGRGTVVHDPYSSGMGQNLTELSFILLHSGALNGLSNKRTADIIRGAMRRYLSGILPEDETESIDKPGVLDALRSSSRRFRLVRRYWTPAAWALALVVLAGTTAFIALSGTWEVSLCYAMAAGLILATLSSYVGAEKIPGNIPGWAIHPLIMDVVKPAVELLRKNSATVGIEALDHPSGSRWRGRMRVLFIASVPAAVLIPAGLFGVGASLVSALLIFTLGILPSPWTIAAAALIGAMLLPARLILGRISSGSPRS
ncbi:hypothetical protein ACFL2T_04510 [Elusimicrobiota bacterium]